MNNRTLSLLQIAGVILWLVCVLWAYHVDLFSSFGSIKPVVYIAVLLGGWLAIVVGLKNL